MEYTLTGCLIGFSTEITLDHYANSLSLAQWSLSNLTITRVLSAYATKRHSMPRDFTVGLGKSHRR